MTVAELLERTSSSELTEWQAYERVAGPLGPARADVQSAIVAATVANANRSKGKPATPADFVPRWDRKPTQTVEEMVAIAYALNAAFGGTVEGGKDGATQ
ncbi:phage tail assembly protein T [Actinomadura fulvescens]|uniref:Minor tail T domain-containing protein n=1 Tax=Actinomadura fulvescens TaxID=46160 RepID=A0ABP6CCL6_9ACTN